MTTFQDYWLEMQERTARVAELRGQAAVPEHAGPRYGRLVARVGAALERVGRRLQATAGGGAVRLLGEGSSAGDSSVAKWPQSEHPA